MSKEKASVDRSMYVVKSNELIRQSRYSLTLQQQRLVLYAISKIRPTDSVNTWYEFSIPDVCEACGIDVKNNGGYYYNALKEDLLKLTRREWGIMPDGSEKTISWMGDVEITPANSTVKICFNPNMRPFLFELKERYTQYRLENVLVFKSTYTIRLYELLRSYMTQQMIDEGNEKIQTFDLDQLRRNLGTNGYKRWADFEKYILRKAVNELNTYSDEIRVVYRGNRNGRSITSVTFRVSTPEGADAFLANRNKNSRLK